MNFRLLALAIGLSCSIAWAADDTAAPALEPIAPGAKAAAPQVTSFAPLAYFNANCARCHGEDGSFYGENFAKNLNDDSLHEAVQQMANGPAQAPLAPADLEVVTAWHRAFRDKKPFVVIVKAEKTGAIWQLSGEVSPGATLQINGESAKVDGSNWTYALPADTDASALKLRVQQGEVITEIDASATAFSSNLAPQKPTS